MFSQLFRVPFLRTSVLFPQGIRQRTYALIFVSVLLAPPKTSGSFSAISSRIFSVIPSVPTTKTQLQYVRTLFRVCAIRTVLRTVFCTVSSTAISGTGGTTSSVAIRDFEFGVGKEIVSKFGKFVFRICENRKPYLRKTIRNSFKIRVIYNEYFKFSTKVIMFLIVRFLFINFLWVFRKKKKKL